jgi:general secretion pathway protein J
MKKYKRTIRFFPRHEAGMSLLEVMIGVFLIGMIGVATVGVISRTQDARELIGHINDRYHGARVTLDRMSRELAMAFISVPSAAIADLSKRPLTLFQAREEAPISRLLFSSFSHVRMIRNAPESDQAIIEYYGKPNPKDPRSHMLLRRHKTVINSQPEQGGVAYVLLERVKKLEFRYWDRRKNDWVTSWDTLRIEYLNLLPSMVEIRLTIADEKGEETTFLTRTQIVMQRVLKRQ